MLSDQPDYIRLIWHATCCACDFIAIWYRPFCWQKMINWLICNLGLQSEIQSLLTWWRDGGWYVDWYMKYVVGFRFLGEVNNLWRGLIFLCHINLIMRLFYLIHVQYYIIVFYLWWGYIYYILICICIYISIIFFISTSSALFTLELRWPANISIRVSFGSCAALSQQQLALLNINWNWGLSEE